MSVLGTARPSAAYKQTMERRAQGDTRPPPGWLETIGASFEEGQADRFGTDRMRRYNAHVPVVEALEELGNDRARYRIDPRIAGGAEWDYARIWRDIAQLPKEQRQRLGVPDNQAAFDEQWRSAAREPVEAASAVAARGGLAPRLIGGIGAAATDPLNWVTAGLGGVGRTAALRILSEAGVNAGIEGLLQPLINVERRAQGRDELTLGEMAINVGAGAAFAGGVRGAVEAAPAVGRAAARATGLDKPMRERDFARAFAEMMPEEVRTPQQQAALDILTREAEIDEASPFTRTYEADDAHRARLSEAMERLDRPATPARPAVRPTPARADFAQVKAAIAGPESGGDDLATNRMGSSASGRYQFIEDTFKGLYRSVYRVDAATAERAWNTRRFDPAVQERLMDRLLAENTRALESAGITADQGNLYVAHVLGSRTAARFIRAAPDTPVSRFVSAEAIRQNPTYLGGDKTVAEALAVIRGKVGGEAAPGPVRTAVADEGEDDALLAALDAEAADIDLARVRNDAEAADLFNAREAADDGAPELRRDLFPDETSWRIAQAEADAEALGLDPAVTRQSVWEEARATLTAAKAGEVPGALFHAEVGPIDVRWGNEDGGLAHIVAKHEEVLDDLPEILAAMEVTKATSNRVHLESPDHVAKVRLDYDGEAQTWLLTAFTKDRKAPPAAEDGGAAGPMGTGRRDRSPSAGAADNIRAPAAVRNLPDDLAARLQAAEPGASAASAPVASAPSRAEVRQRIEQAEAALREWDDGLGDAAQRQTDSVLHDIEQRLATGEALGVRMDETGEGIEAADDVLAAIAEDLELVETLRGCL